MPYELPLNSECSLSSQIVLSPFSVEISEPKERDRVWYQLPCRVDVLIWRNMGIPYSTCRLSILRALLVMRGDEESG